MAIENEESNEEFDDFPEMEEDSGGDTDEGFDVRDAEQLRLEITREAMKKLNTNNPDIETEISDLDMGEIIHLASMDTIDEILGPGLNVYEPFKKSYKRHTISKHRRGRKETLRVVQFSLGGGEGVMDDDTAERQTGVRRLLSRFRRRD
jgi:hypothetical protein